MKDPKGSYNNDAFDELLRQFMLEESANDPDMADKLDQEAQRVFAEEPIHKPDPAREQALIADLNEKLHGTGSNGSGGNSKWWLWGSALVLLTMGIGAYLFIGNTSDKGQLKVDNSVPIEISKETPQSTETPIVLSLSNGTNQLSYKSTSSLSLASMKEEPVGGLSVMGNVTNGQTNAKAHKPIALKKELLPEMERKLALYNAQLPEERVFVHTDRNFYVSGNTIWYTAYVRNGNDLTTSISSEILYLELLSEEGSIVLANRVKIDNGNATGALLLDKRLPSGDYRLRAYTLWESQKGKGQAFEKHIYLEGLNTKGKGAGVTAAKTKPTLELYPEGGYAIVGIDGRVAVALSNNDNAKASLLNGDGDKVLDFEVINGKGQFHFTPEDGEEYLVEVDEHKYAFPKILPTGIAMSVAIPEKDKLQVELKAQRKENVLLVGMIRGTIYYAEVMTLGAGSKVVTVPLTNMPAGVLQLSLFDDKGTGHAERLTFVNAHKKLNVQVLTDKANYQPREQVNVTVKVTDDRGRPVSTELSMAVVDDQLHEFTNAGRTNMVSEMLLAADLDKYVDDPVAYLNGGKEKLDLLLMTAGWRRFSLPEVYYNKYDVPSIAHEKSVVSGRVVDGATGVPLNGVELRSKLNGVKLLTDKEGKFEIQGLDLSKLVELDLSYNVGLMSLFVNRYESDLTIEFWGDGRRVYQQAEADMPHPVIAGDESLPKGTYVVVGQVVNSLGQAIPKATVKAEGPKTILHYAVSDNKGFYTLILPKAGEYQVWAEGVAYNPSKPSNVDIAKGSVVLLDMLLDKRSVPSVSTKALDPLQQSDYMDGRYEAIGTFDPKYLDPKADKDAASSLLAIDKNTIYYVDGYKMGYGSAVSIPYQVLADREWYANGVPAKYSDKLNALDNVDEARSKMLELELYANNKKPESFKQLYEQKRDYPEITYTYSDRISKNRTDLRATLYWNGAVTTNKQGVATFSFYASDDITRFRIVGQSISDKGLPGIGETLASIQLPYIVHADVPELSPIGSKMSVLLSCENLADMLMAGKWEFVLPNSVEPIWPLADDFTLFPIRNDTLTVNLKVVGPVGKDTMTISFVANGYEHSVKKVLNIRPEGSDSAILQP